MFEQNNVGVQMKLPLAEAVEQMLSAGASPDPAAAAFLKDSLQRILDNIDGECQLLGNCLVQAVGSW